MILNRLPLPCLALIALLLFPPPGAGAVPIDPVLADWTNPPQDARLRAYWWWLNGNVTKEAITRDLEQMKAKGFGGALICDADGSSQDGNARAPRGPVFFSPEWRQLYQFTLREAARLGLEMSLNIQSGWNLGGPMVKAEDAPKKLVWTETRLKGGVRFSGKLAQAKARDGFYRDLFVLAYRVNPGVPAKRPPLQNLGEKALNTPLRPFSAPDTSGLFQEIPATAGEEDARSAEVLDLTKMSGREGDLEWTVPAGEWVVLRFGYTLNDHCRVSTCSQGWEGYALDPFDPGAFQRYWDVVVEPLIADAGPLAGKTLKYLHTDSWEVEVANWTPSLLEQFKRRRGYDLLPWLPVIAGKIVDSREASNRFLHDFRRTMGDLAIDHHYRLFRDNAHRHGLLIHPESGGPHAVPIDAQQCLGFNDAPMSEFWASSWKHRIGDDNRYFVKQPASAAHTNGRKLVLAEGFTTIGPHWQETLWDNLKPAFDRANCEGLNLLVWHAFVCSPASEGIPGQQYFAGTHLNPNVTWWEKSKPFFDYVNRCQAMLQQGIFHADVLYYYGDHVPNFTQHRRKDPAKLGSGFDYDVISEEALLARTTVRDGRIMLPDGVSYRILVLPDREIISLPALRKVRELVAKGATVVGPRPKQASGLHDAARADAEVGRIAEELWGKGRVISGRTAREVLLEKRVTPDFEWQPAAGGPVDVDFIHRMAGGIQIYFVSNLEGTAASGRAVFRVAGLAPELWNPVTGERRFAAAYQTDGGRVSVPLDFAPYGSWFVVFGDPVAAHPPKGVSNTPASREIAVLNGAWTVKFDPRWGGPGEAEFPALVSWTERPEPGIKHYSGTAVYRKEFGMPEATGKSRIRLDLGKVRELAEVRLNGKSCGTVWAPPFSVDITDALKPGVNRLEIEVVNFWPNRIIGDAALPPAERLTKTNVRKLTKGTALMPSGLFGPVSLHAVEQP